MKNKLQKELLNIYKYCFIQYFLSLIKKKLYEFLTESQFGNLYSLSVYSIVKGTSLLHNFLIFKNTEYKWSFKSSYCSFNSSKSGYSLRITLNA
ncbi:hypothetical protein BpHYR1_026947 [Brachionus plicatilis]|uniref:Uncharacterized protein n=1 Tax=Brachionus plicatilis TaxID=10195 RepID=A0A3M7PUU4_BRAPC|nr:hypothetical protein BpHYR1_026947 [Brachionus plicatilis]